MIFSLKFSNETSPFLNFLMEINIFKTVSHFVLLNFLELKPRAKYKQKTISTLELSKKGISQTMISLQFVNKNFSITIIENSLTLPFGNALRENTFDGKLSTTTRNLEKKVKSFSLDFLEPS